MNISSLITSLSEKQRTGFIACLNKIKDKKKLSQHDIESVIDDDSCSGVRIQRVFGITRMSLNRWVDEGCPRNPEGSYSIGALYKWRMGKLKAKTEAPAGFKEQKLIKEIEFLETRIQEKRDQYIERSLHETILVSRAGSLRTFLEKTAMANAVHLAGKTVDEVRAQLYRLLQAAMEAYAGKGNNE